MAALPSRAESIRPNVKTKREIYHEARLLLKPGEPGSAMIAMKAIVQGTQKVAQQDAHAANSIVRGFRAAVHKDRIKKVLAQMMDTTPEELSETTQANVGNLFSEFEKMEVKELAPLADDIIEILVRYLDATEAQSSLKVQLEALIDQCKFISFEEGEKSVEVILRQVESLRSEVAYMRKFAFTDKCLEGVLLNIGYVGSLMSRCHQSASAHPKAVVSEEVVPEVEQDFEATTPSVTCSTENLPGHRSYSQKSARRSLTFSSTSNKKAHARLERKTTFLDTVRGDAADRIDQWKARLRKSAPSRLGSNGLPEALHSQDARPRALTSASDPLGPFIVTSFVRSKEGAMSKDNMNKTSSLPSHESSMIHGQRSEQRQTRKANLFLDDDLCCFSEEQVIESPRVAPTRQARKDKRLSAHSPVESYQGPLLITSPRMRQDQKRRVNLFLDDDALRVEEESGITSPGLVDKVKTPSAHTTVEQQHIRKTSDYEEPTESPKSQSIRSKEKVKTPSAQANVDHPHRPITITSSVYDHSLASPQSTSMRSKDKVQTPSALDSFDIEQRLPMDVSHAPSQSTAIPRSSSIRSKEKAALRQRVASAPSCCDKDLVDELHELSVETCVDSMINDAFDGSEVSSVVDVDEGSQNQSCSVKLSSSLGFPYKLLPASLRNQLQKSREKLSNADMMHAERENGNIATGLSQHGFLPVAPERELHVACGFRPRIKRAMVIQEVYESSSAAVHRALKQLHGHLELENVVNDRHCRSKAASRKAVPTRLPDLKLLPVLPTPDLQEATPRAPQHRSVAEGVSTIDLRSSSVDNAAQLDSWNPNHRQISASGKLGTKLALALRNHLTVVEDIKPFRQSQALSGLVALTLKGRDFYRSASHEDSTLLK